MEDDFELVQIGLIALNNGRYDIFDLYRLNDNDGSDYVYGVYAIKKWHIIIGRADNVDQLSRNLSAIAVFSEKGLNQPRGVSINVFYKDLYFN